MVVSDFQVFIRDVLQHVDVVQKDHPGLPIFLLGHSMVSRPQKSPLSQAGPQPQPCGGWRLRVPGCRGPPCLWPHRSLPGQHGPLWEFPDNLCSGNEGQHLGGSPREAHLRPFLPARAQGARKVPLHGGAPRALLPARPHLRAGGPLSQPVEKHRSCASCPFQSHTVHMGIRTGFQRKQVLTRHSKSLAPFIYIKPPKNQATIIFKSGLFKLAASRPNLPLDPLPQWLAKNVLSYLILKSG